MQQDCNEIIPGAAISCSPNEPYAVRIKDTAQIEDRVDRAESEARRRPFFEMAARWKARYIVDLRCDLDTSDTCDVQVQDYASNNNKPKYLALDEEGVERYPDKRIQVTPLVYTNQPGENEEDRGTHEMFHIAVTNLGDNRAFNDEQFDALFGQLHAIEGAHREGNVIYHCNGGLGRAPTVLTARTLWEWARRAREFGMDVVWDEGNQNQLVCDNTLNLAALYKRMLILGIHSRSTFIQSKAQFDALRGYGRHLAALAPPAPPEPPAPPAQG
jgi:hypothetical protein